MSSEKRFYWMIVDSRNKNSVNVGLQTSPECANRFRASRPPGRGSPNPNPKFHTLNPKMPGTSDPGANPDKFVRFAIAPARLMRSGPRIVLSMTLITRFVFSRCPCCLLVSFQVSKKLVCDEETTRRFVLHPCPLPRNMMCPHPLHHLTISFFARPGRLWNSHFPDGIQRKRINSTPSHTFYSSSAA